MISVLVATYNRAARLRRLLASLHLAALSTTDAWELLVVDNNSSDETEEVLARAAADASLPLRVVRERRQGKSYAINAGIAESRGDVLAFTDDDAVVASSWLRQMGHRIASHPDAIGFGGRVVPRWDAERPRWLGTRPLVRVNGGVLAYDLGDEVVELRRGVPPPVGANFFFRREAFERYGLFREDLGPRAGRQLYGEDTEFVYRLLLTAGERLLYVPDVWVSHPVEPERLERLACLSWNFRVGRSAARIAGRMQGARTTAGIPLYVFRLLLGDAVALVRELVRGDVSSRFGALQEIVYRLGIIREFRGLPRDFDPSRFVPVLASHRRGAAV